MSRGLCECGCGQRTNLAPHNAPSKGWVKGRPLRYIDGHRTQQESREDDRAIAYYTGRADARNGRPRRVDIADTSMIGDAYTRGFNSLAGDPS